MILRNGKSKVNGRSLTRRSFRPCPATMQRNNATDICQANTCAFKFFLGMQTLEYTEKPVGIVHVKTNAVIFNETDIFASVISAPNFDLCAETRTCEFDSVGDEIDKHKL